ncbi:MAG: RNA polymerase subunit sigma-24, partial [Bacteroidota bacterium]
MAPPSSFREDELIDGIRNGGAKARRYENALFQQFGRLVWQRSTKWALSDEQARDAYTDAVIVVIRHLREGIFRGESSLYTYLRKIFSNKCIDVSRKKTTAIYEDPE